MRRVASLLVAYLGSTAAAASGSLLDVDTVHLEARQNTLNMQAWNDATSAACTQQLAQLDQASNPSGTSICYNLPQLNANSGRFIADLRLYKISEPVGDFLTVPPESVRVGLAYNGATVSQVTADNLAAASASVGSNIRAAMNKPELVKRANPQLLQSYLFVGQIDPAKQPGNMQDPDLEALIIPTLTLTATAANGQRVSTNVSANEAAFLTGVFSDSNFQSDFSRAQASVDNDMALLRQGQIAFVLPGVSFMIFPTGLVITSIWLALGLMAYGFGTWQRIGYRDMYKRRIAVNSLTGKRI